MPLAAWKIRQAPLADLIGFRNDNVLHRLLQRSSWRHWAETVTCIFNLTICMPTPYLHDRPLRTNRTPCFEKVQMQTYDFSHFFQFSYMWFLSLTWLLFVTHLCIARPVSKGHVLAGLGSAVTLCECNLKKDVAVFQKEYSQQPVTWNYFHTFVYKPCSKTIHCPFL